MRISCKQIKSFIQFRQINILLIIIIIFDIPAFLVIGISPNTSNVLGTFVFLGKFDMGRNNLLYEGRSVDSWVPLDWFLVKDVGM